MRLVQKGMKSRKGCHLLGNLHNTFLSSSWSLASDDTSWVSESQLTCEALPFSLATAWPPGWDAGFGTAGCAAGAALVGAVDMTEVKDEAQPRERFCRRKRLKWSLAFRRRDLPICMFSNPKCKQGVYAERWDE